LRLRWGLWSLSQRSGSARGFVAAYSTLGLLKQRLGALPEADAAARVALQVLRGAERRYIKVDRVVCAVDCGMLINPDVIAAQMEGSIGFGGALYGAVTLKDGKVEQTNFDGYQADSPERGTIMAPQRKA